MRHETPIVENRNGTPEECLLYLPSYDVIAGLKTGVDEGARFYA